MIEATADEPHHPDLEAQLSPPPRNYTCIIRTRIHTRTHTLVRVGIYSIHTVKTACDTPDQCCSHVPTSPRAPESLWSSNSLSMHMHRAIITKGEQHCFVKCIFIFQLDNHSSALRLRMGFFCRVCVFPVTFSPFAASLCVSASRCLPSDVIAPVQNGRRLGIW